MTKRHLDYKAWALRVVTWDAVLPAFVAFLPLGVKVIFPNRRGVMELTAVTLPAAAFFFRFRAGKRTIGSNHCTRLVQAFQFCIFCIGIFPLALIECVIILTDLMPKGAVLKDPGNRITLVVLISVYLVAMVTAMYPGRTERVASEWDDFHPYQDAW